MTEHIITKVVKGSIAEELEIEAGDRLLSINGKEIKDVFDYYFFIEEEYIEVSFLKPNGEEWIFEIEKDYNEDLGIKFEADLMDNYKSCRNKCIFCFIDQMPKGMRKTLYFKDDDSRLSFLKGNYITLTNMKEDDIQRIIKYRMSPINVSVHTTNPELRKKMLNNKFAGQVLEYIQRLADAGITLNGQIVLCKGVNDGEELNRSIRELSDFIPHMQSVSVVPVGISKYREGLYNLEPFSKDDAIAVVDLIESWQKKISEETGKHFIHASDEFYILSERPIPEEERYDGYLQLENGVGMVRLFMDEFESSFKKLKSNTEISKKLTIATSLLPLSIINHCASQLKEKFPNVDLKVIGIKNKFFGDRITVSGLLTGSDIIEQLKGIDLGDELLLPSNLLKAEEEILLDDITVKEIEDELKTSVRIVETSGKDLIEAILEKS
ncbi:DUF512 domain-containing protein [Vallitalea okinawensis]|uniref:DUF512 domain-containing protein n=1 Tax=Vallitalea okinawensis TaxID=2078660 RepID=UPI000CFD1412|nr:DUF512 domain-containing protein [Vallitalea okinawensis]